MISDGTEGIAQMTDIEVCDERVVLAIAVISIESGQVEAAQKLLRDCQLYYWPGNVVLHPSLKARVVSILES